MLVGGQVGATTATKHKVDRGAAVIPDIVRRMSRIPRDSNRPENK